MNCFEDSDCDSKLFDGTSEESSCVFLFWSFDLWVFVDEFLDALELLAEEFVVEPTLSLSLSRSWTSDWM